MGNKDLCRFLQVCRLRQHFVADRPSAFIRKPALEVDVDEVLDVGQAERLEAVLRAEDARQKKGQHHQGQPQDRQTYDQTGQT